MSAGLTVSVVLTVSFAAALTAPSGRSDRPLCCAGRPPATVLRQCSDRRQTRSVAGGRRLAGVNRVPARVSARLAAIAESATLAVDAKAKALQASGADVIGFGAGEPDFPTPQPIVDAAIAACADPKNHKYSPAAGLPELRQAIADKTLRDSGFETKAANVLVTNGGKHAVYAAFAVPCDPGDEVLLPAPYWTTYPEAIALAGGVAKVIDTTEETDFQVTVEQLDAA